MTTTHYVVASLACTVLLMIAGIGYNYAEHCETDCACTHDHVHRKAWAERKNHFLALLVFALSGGVIFALYAGASLSYKLT